MTPKPALIATALAAVIAVALSASVGLQAQGTPPGKARQGTAALAPGDILTADEIDIIERPGQYGLGADLRGSRYAISDGHLVRIDADSLQVQSVLRSDVHSVD